MSVSPQLLALMSVTPTRSGGVTSWSILMDFRYPFSWETTTAFVLRVKAKGPPDEMVTLEVDRNVFKYNVHMPWYARLVLGKNIIWHDVLHANPATKTLSEDGINMSLQRLGTVRDCSSWRACEDDPNVTMYSKRVDFDIRMPVGPTIMMQVAQPLMRWFRTKSHLCRELEVQAIRDFIEAEKGKTEEERTERLANDAAWMASLTAEATPPVSPPPPAPSSSCCSSEADRKEQVHAEEEQAQPTTRLAGARARVKNVVSKVRAKLAKAVGAGAAERSRSQAATRSAAAAAAGAAADGSSA
ncbi:unnamed protein product [Ectocarpus sp. 12 AP-2014]